MKFRWSNKEFLLNRQNTVLDDDTLYVHHAGSAGYSADRVVACVLTKRYREVKNMAQVKIIAPQTREAEHLRVAAYRACRWPSARRPQARLPTKQQISRTMTVPHGMPKP